jgi:hypothetical protein
MKDIEKVLLELRTINAALLAIWKELRKENELQSKRSHAHRTI